MSWNSSLILCVALAPHAGAQEATEERPFASAVEGNNRFAIETYRRAARAQENLVLSPLSILSALELVLAGAAGATREELEGILYPGTRSLRVAGESLALRRKLVEDGNVYGTLRLASALWAQEGSNLLPEYLAAISARPYTSVESVDFRGDPAAACARLNEWTKERTGGLIEGGWDPARIDPLLDLLIANALYFHADWTGIFETNPSHAPFWLDERQRVQTTTMSRKASFRHYSDPRLEAVVIPYRGKAFAMLILLPEDVDGGLAVVEEALTPEYVSRILSEAKAREMKLRMPRFELRSRLSAADVLPGDVLPRAFRPGSADLSAMTGDEDAFAGGLEHETIIQVNERGTKVAAVTRVKIYRGPGPPPAPEMRVDHPFLVAILHQPTGAILALGRLVRPEGEVLPDGDYSIERTWRTPRDSMSPGTRDPFPPPGPRAPIRRSE